MPETFTFNTLAVRDVRNKFDESTQNKQFLIQILEENIKWNDEIKNSLLKEIKDLTNKKNFKTLFAYIHQLSNINVSLNGSLADRKLDDLKQSLTSLLYGFEEFILYYKNWTNVHHPSWKQNSQQGIYTFKYAEKNSSLKVDNNLPQTIINPDDNISDYSDNEEHKDHELRMIPEESLSQLMSYMKSSYQAIAEYKAGIQQLTASVQELRTENQLLKTVQNNNLEKQQKEMNSLLLELKNIRSHPETTGVHFQSTALPDNCAIPTSTQFENEDFQEKADPDSKLVKILSQLLIRNESTVNNTSLFRNSIPKEFEPKTPFLNYQWFVTLESSLKDNQGLNLSKRLELLKRLVVKNTNGWLQFEEEIASFRTWTEVRDEFFEKFVTTKQLARRVFEEKFIEEGQSPEHFLYELRLLADVAGMTCNPNYKTILRDRFLYGLQNATAFQFYYLHKEMFPDVNAVLKQFRSSGRLRKDNLNELKPSKGEEFSLTRNTINFAGSSRGSRKQFSTPSRLSKPDKEARKKYQGITRRLEQ